MIPLRRQVQVQVQVVPQVFFGSGPIFVLTSLVPPNKPVIMVWLMSFPDAPDCLLGPVDPREEAAMTKYLWSSDAKSNAVGADIRVEPTHYHVKDFNLDEMNR